MLQRETEVRNVLNIILGHSIQYELVMIIEYC